MSLQSTNEFRIVQRRILTLYERGPLMETEQLNRAIDGLTNNILEMIRRRREEMIIYSQPNQPPRESIRNKWYYNCNIKHIWNVKDIDLNAPCSENCPICMENHTRGDSLTTSCCGNQYGKDCFIEWMNTEASNKQCPTCRKDYPSIIMYKKNNIHNSSHTTNNTSDNTSDNITNNTSDNTSDNTSVTSGDNTSDTTTDITL
jgi:hypothetical protein